MNYEVLAETRYYLFTRNFFMGGIWEKTFLNFTDGDMEYQKKFILIIC